jgi:hypothetical protein
MLKGVPPEFCTMPEVDSSGHIVKPEPLLQFFGEFYAKPWPVHEAFAKLAKEIVEILPRNPERTVALRKLIEAKDAAIRASQFKG